MERILHHPSHINIESGGAGGDRQCASLMLVSRRVVQDCFHRPSQNRALCSAGWTDSRWFARPGFLHKGAALLALISNILHRQNCTLPCVMQSVKHGCPGERNTLHKTMLRFPCAWIMSFEFAYAGMSRFCSAQLQPLKAAPCCCLYPGRSMTTVHA